MKQKKMSAFTVISTIILLVLTVLFVFPFYWILTGAFKSQPDTIVIPPQWWPKMPTLENFQQLMVQTQPCNGCGIVCFLASDHVFGLHYFCLSGLCSG